MKGVKRLAVLFERNKVAIQMKLEAEANILRKSLRRYLGRQYSQSAGIRHSFWQELGGCEFNRNRLAGP